MVAFHTGNRDIMLRSIFLVSPGTEIRLVAKTNNKKQESKWSDVKESLGAHTLPAPNASTRVLAKCGFERTGEVEDPEDGLVWRWERSKKSA